jgi:hypothetical protein
MMATTATLNTPVQHTISPATTIVTIIANHVAVSFNLISITRTHQQRQRQSLP